MKTEENKKRRARGRVCRRGVTIVGIVICGFVLPILVVNLILLAKSIFEPEEVPRFLGLSPMIVVTNSMDPAISAGDMIIVRREDPDLINVGDVISFYNPQNIEKKGVITHRVIGIEEEADGTRTFTTKGDANNTPDPVPVPEERLVGVYKESIPYLGNVALFMKTPGGMLLCVVLPLCLIMLYDMILRQIREKQEASYRSATRPDEITAALRSKTL